MGMFDAVFRRGDYREFDGDWVHPVRTVDFNEVIYVVKEQITICLGEKLWINLKTNI